MTATLLADGAMMMAVRSVVQVGERTTSLLVLHALALALVAPLSEMFAKFGHCSSDPVNLVLESLPQPADEIVAVFFVGALNMLLKLIDFRHDDEHLAIGPLQDLQVDGGNADALHVDHVDVDRHVKNLIAALGGL